MKEDTQKFEIIEDSKLDLSLNLPMGVTPLSEDEAHDLSGGGCFIKWNDNCVVNTSTGCVAEW